MLFIIFCYLFIGVLEIQQNNNILLGSLYIICAILNIILYYLLFYEKEWRRLIMAKRRSELEIEYRKRAGVVQLNFLIPAELRDRLNEKCRVQGISRRAWLEAQIEKYINEMI